MLYIYELITRGCFKEQITSEFLSKFKELIELNAVDITKARDSKIQGDKKAESSEFYKLKKDYLIGSVEVTQRGIVFLKPFVESSELDSNNSKSGAESSEIHKDYLLICQTTPKKKHKISKNKTFFSSGDIVLAKIGKPKTKKGITKKVAYFIDMLYKKQSENLAIVKAQGKAFKAYELSASPTTNKPNVLNLNASQKSLKALPKDCVIKVDNQGYITKVLGVLSNPCIDSIIALERYDRQESFESNVQSYANAYGNSVDKSMYPRRVDLTHLPFCVIDPEDARDHDDSIYFDKKRNALYVAIADVSEYVAINTPLDLAARQRAFSIYFPNKVIPMLPFSLSSGICSLKQGEDRLALIFEIQLDSEGGVIRHRLFEGIIKSAANITYAQVDILLKNMESKTRLRHKIPPKIANMLKNMLPMIKILRQKRLENGYEFHNNELQITLDEDENLKEISLQNHSLAHSIIEESMLLANKQAAAILGSVPQAIYRNHAKPSFGKIKGICKDLAIFDMPMPKGKDIHNTISYIQEFFANTYEQSHIDKMIIKSFAKAVYGSKNLGHFGLGFKRYTHFTSPIRRYSDLIAHRMLKTLLKRTKQMPFLLEGIDSKLRYINNAERDIARIEFEYLDRKFVRFVEANLKKKKSIVLQAMALNDGIFIALDTLPNAKIFTGENLPTFSIKNIKLTRTDILQNAIYGEVL